MDRVAKNLESSKDCQNDDGKLIANIWYEDLKNQGVPPTEAMKIARLIGESPLTNSESIRRCRQKLQEQDPNKYGINHHRKSKEEKFKNEVRNA